MSRRDAFPPFAGSAPGLAILTALLASGCQQIGPAVYGVTEPPLSCAAARGYDEAGTASWYGRAHHGRRTASGQRFDMHGLTAAHRRLPLGSKVRVTNRNNGKSVLLTITDRGPFVPGRVVDVSYGAAKELNFVGAGLAPVRVTAVETC